MASNERTPYRGGGSPLCDSLAPLILFHMYSTGHNTKSQWRTPLAPL